MTLEERARVTLANIVPLSISSTWDETETRNIVRAMLAFAAEERERCAKVMDDRVALYLAKADKRDPFAEDSMNAWDGSQLCAEASEEGATAIRNMEQGQ